MKRIVAIIQARMASTRLPNKVVADVCGRPLIEHVVERVRRAERVADVCIATTVNPEDDAIRAAAERIGVPVFSGSEQDVLDRFRGAAGMMKADAVVRITCDCPLIDPEVIDRVIGAFEDSGADYACNVLPPTFPDGLDTEVFSRAALERAWRDAALKSEREHVTPYFYNHPEWFQIANVTNDRDLSSLRWTVDEPSDLELVRLVYRALHPEPFRMADVLLLLENNRDWTGVNAGIGRNEGYLKSLREDEAMKKDERGKGPSLYAEARKIIPGGTQLLSKRPEMFLPDLWPSYYSRAKGAEVWDLDGNRYLDMTHNGVGSFVLGAADPDVDAAVMKAIEAGSMSTLNCPEEVELARLMLELHPWARMVRYARGGGEAMTVAVRIARAHTGRDVVAFCGYHGWHDWYLSANLAGESALDGHLLPGLDPAGVPRGLRGTALPFHYNRLDELAEILDRNRGRVAAVVMEPLRNDPPEEGYLGKVKEMIHREGGILVIDEVSAGFRLVTGGAHLLYGLEPDMAVFAKAMSNGYPMAAVLGTRDVMEAAQKTFISSTYWTDRVGPAAALATIRKFRECDVAGHLVRIGRMVQEGWTRVAGDAGLSIGVGGIAPLSHFHFNDGQALEARTLFTQWMLEKGILAGAAFYPTFAHREEHVARYLEAAGDVFGRIAAALQKGPLADLLRGPVAHGGFQRLN